MLTCVKERVGVSSNHHIHTFDLFCDLFVYRKTRVTECDDLIDTQSCEFADLCLQSCYLLLKDQVWT